MSHYLATVHLLFFVFVLFVVVFFVDNWYTEYKLNCKAISYKRQPMVKLLINVGEPNFVTHFKDFE